VDFINTVQNLLDEGNSMNKVASMLNVHHSKINRLLNRGLVEIYEAFDEAEDKKHLYQNFEWLWEEDVLEDLVSKAFEGYVVLDKSQSEDYVAIGQYVRSTYGSLKKYFCQKGVKRLQRYVLISCPSCENTTPLTKWYERKEFTWGLYWECPTCRTELFKKYAEKYPEKVFENNIKRREMSEELPGSYVKEDWIKVREDFNWKCAFTSEMGCVTMDHFIPVITGHGGTFEGNLVPIIKNLNSSKNGRNPFRWKSKKGVDRESFVKVVAYLAELNSLTPLEYEEFVYWCFDNRRNIDEVRADRRHSIEIWREAAGLHFPLPKYALNGIGNRSTDETATVVKKEVM
jgi:hypothetical protein